MPCPGESAKSREIELIRDFPNAPSADWRPPRASPAGKARSSKTSPASKDAGVFRHGSHGFCARRCWGRAHRPGQRAARPDHHNAREAPSKSVGRAAAWRRSRLISGLLVLLGVRVTLGGGPLPLGWLSKGMTWRWCSACLAMLTWITPIHICSHRVQPLKICFLRPFE